MVKKGIIGAILVLLVLSSVAFAAEPIKIGYVANLTGDAATWGVHEKNGAIIAVEEINATGSSRTSAGTGGLRREGQG